MALSPQGPKPQIGGGGFGAFDNGGDDNTWFPIEIPAFCMCGSEEKDGTIANFIVEDWRLQPFFKYDATKHDSFNAVLAGQDHSDLGLSQTASPAVISYITKNARLFFQVYLENQTDQLCNIGTLDALPDLDFRRRLWSQNQDKCVSQITTASPSSSPSSAQNTNVLQSTSSQSIPENTLSSSVTNTLESESESEPMVFEPSSDDSIQSPDASSSAFTVVLAESLMILMICLMI